MGQGLMGQGYFWKTTFRYSGKILGELRPSNKDFEWGMGWIGPFAAFSTALIIFVFSYYFVTDIGENCENHDPV